MGNSLTEYCCWSWSGVTDSFCRQAVAAVVAAAAANINNDAAVATALADTGGGDDTGGRFTSLAGVIHGFDL